MDNKLEKGTKIKDIFSDYNIIFKILKISLIFNIVFYFKKGDSNFSELNLFGY